MKVLQVWDVAGVSSVFSKYLRQRGIISDVITRSSLNLYGFEGVYSEVTISCDVSVNQFYMTALKKAAYYDILHIHSLDKLTPLMRVFRRKPVILHYHGSDIRGHGASLQKRILQWFANRILVSTPDLLKDLKTATYLPNPVDTDMFYPRLEAPKPATASFFLKSPDGDEELRQVTTFAENKGLQLRVYNTISGIRVPHMAMRQVYTSREFFIDRVKIKSLSKMALEALACGVKVWKDDILLTTLPQEHQPNYVINQLLSIYSDLLK